jgi:putative endonuclease
VLLRSKTLVFCEVKTRSDATYGAAVEAVTPVKQARIRRLAVRWLAQERPVLGLVRPTELRFDVAAVTGESVEVVEGAF